MTFFAKPFDQLSAREVYEILKARMEIFTLGQNIRCLDMDGKDLHALHCFFWQDDRIAAYLRAYYDEDGAVKIGRVLTRTHGKGHGKQLLQQSLQAFRTALPAKTVRVHAQKHAVGFYTACGFTATSDDFYEEGVLHQAMERAL